jgi:hypothetical protein
MNTVYLYIQKYQENMCALPCSPEGQAEPPLDLKRIVKISCARDHEIHDLSVDQMRALIDKAYHQPGMSATCDQVVCYDGNGYGKTRTVIHTRNLVAGSTTV